MRDDGGRRAIADVRRSEYVQINAHSHRCDTNNTGTLRCPDLATASRAKHACMVAGYDIPDMTMP